MSLVPGDVARLTYTLTVDGTLTDATVALTVSAPDGTTSTPTVTHPGLGNYQADVPVTQAGNYTYTWTASGTATDVEVGTFTVDGPLLCSVSEAKAQINKGATVDDDELLAYIRAVTAPVEDFCGAILPRTVTEWHQPSGGTLILREERVISVTSISEYVGTSLYAYTAAADPSLAGTYSYLVDPTTPSVIRVLNQGGQGRWLGGQLAVTYVAGMTSVPPAINLAARLLVADLWETQQGGAGLPPVFTDDNVTVSGTPMPRGRRAYELLSRYRRSPAIA